MTKIIYSSIAVALVLGVLGVMYIQPAVAPTDDDPEVVTLENDTDPVEDQACTMDAKMCPDGSGVGRSGPDCAFAACPGREVAADELAPITAKADLITISTPEPGNAIVSPLQIAGQARGTWFFEATFPVVLTNWDGLIIAEGFVTADGEWMTEDFVPFSGELTFPNPYQSGDPDFMARGTLILQKANASGLPENDDALELPVMFVADES